MTTTQHLDVVKAQPTQRTWVGLTDEAVANSASETVWCSPHCVNEINVSLELF
jgi:hypothetical protein